MKRLVLIEVQVLQGAAHICDPLCQWLRPAEAATCTLFEKPLTERGPRYERLAKCVDAEPRSTAYRGDE